MFYYNVGTYYLLDSDNVLSPGYFRSSSLRKMFH